MHLLGLGSNPDSGGPLLQKQKAQKICLKKKDALAILKENSKVTVNNLFCFNRTLRFKSLRTLTGP